MLPFLPLSSSAMLWIRLSRDFRNQLSKKLQKLLPRHIHISGTAEREQPQTSKSSSSYRAAKKQSAAYRAYRANDWGHGKRIQPQSSNGKADMRTVINSKKAAGKRFWHPRAQAIEEFPPLSRAVDTSFYSAHLPSISQGDWSANPATSCASGRSSLRRAHISQGPPGNVVALGCPPPLRRIAERSIQTHPAGSPFQDVVLSTQIHINPETSLERLVPLV